jgi:hypothetical protein
MLLFISLILINFVLIQSILTKDCINCKHFTKIIYFKSSGITIKPLPLSIGYCKLGLDINAPPTIKIYTSVEEFRSDNNEDNCGSNAKFFTPLKK